MRVVFNGLSDLTAKTAELFIEDNYEVVIMDIDGKKIEEYSEKLDCSFLHGDGSYPDVLKEVNPEDTDILFCLSDDDQNNIIAGLIGRSLGVDRVVIRIEDPQLEEICLELGLKDVIIPSSTVGSSLKDMIDLSGSVEVSTAIKDEARLFAFIADKKNAVIVEDLELPKKSRAICYYRDDKFYLVEEGTQFEEKDEIIILTHSENLPKLEERMGQEE